MTARRIAALLAPVCAALAGCLPDGSRGIVPDAVPTDRSGQVLAAYEQPAMQPPEAEALPRSMPPVQQAEMPGGEDCPWLSAPHTLPRSEGPSAAGQSPPGRAETGTGPTARPAVPATAPDVIRAGDALLVTVARHPEFSGRWRVAADGLLDVPPEGAFALPSFAPERFARQLRAVQGLRPGELEARLAEILKPFLRKPPQVQVKIARRAED